MGENRLIVWHLENLVTFVGGIGIFLYGTHMLSQGMQKIYGAKSRNILKTITGNPLIGILVGALVTVIVNSSAATTVMAIGFVNASLMTLKEALGVIMGANIGTTCTAWLVALMGFSSESALLNPNFYAPLILGIAVFVVILSHNERVKTVAQTIIGLSFLFMGLSFMSKGVTPYSDNPFLIGLFETLGKYPVLALLLGLITTALMQSSTVSLTILQTIVLTSSVTRIAAVFIILGQNIGTCITAILSSLSAGKNAKKTAMLHLLFNVTGALICTVFVIALFPLLDNFLHRNINIFEISIFHTCFNLTNTIILFPFMNQIIALTNFIFKDDKIDEEKIPYSDKVKIRLDERTLTEPLVAFDIASHVVFSYARYVLENLKRGASLAVNGMPDRESINDVYKHEEEIDKSNFMISDYLASLNSKSLTDKQHKKVEDMLGMCSDIERIGDHAENLAEVAEYLIEKDISFSNEAKDELKNISDRAVGSVENAIDCVEFANVSLVKKVRDLEDEVDILRDKYKENHLKRLADGNCSAAAGVIFYEILSNLERVSDHARNLSDFIADSYKK